MKYAYWILTILLTCSFFSQSTAQGTIELNENNTIYYHQNTNDASVKLFSILSGELVSFYIDMPKEIIIVATISDASLRSAVYELSFNIFDISELNNGYTDCLFIGSYNLFNLEDSEPTFFEFSDVKTLNIRSKNDKLLEKILFDLQKGSYRCKNNNITQTLSDLRGFRLNREGKVVSRPRK